MAGEEHAGPTDGEDDLTLGTLVTSLGPETVRVEWAPRGTGLPVHDTLIFDPGVGQTLRAGDLVLAVNIDGTGPDAGALVAAGVDANVAGVVFKRRERDELGFRPEDTAPDTIILSIAPDVPWDSFVSLVRSALNSLLRVPAADDTTTPRNLFALADTVAALLGGAVTITETSMRLLAYSNLGHPIDDFRREGILGRGNTKEWVGRFRADGLIDALLRGDEVVWFRYPEIWPRMGIGVRSGDEVLGFIFVLQSGKPFGPAAEATLQGVARTAALELLRRRSFEEFEHRIHSHLLHQALTSPGGAGISPAQLGVQADETMVVVAFSFDFDEQLMTLRHTRLQNMVMLYAQSVSQRASSTSIGQVLYLLLPLRQGGDTESVTTTLRQVVDKARGLLGLDLTVGVSRPVTAVARLPAARDEADQVLEVLHEHQLGRIATLDRVRSRAVLLQLRRLVGPKLADTPGCLRPLLDHDAAHSTSFVATLRAWLDAFGDAIVAADVLGIHANAVRQRLRRLVEIAGVDLDDPVERFVLQLELYLLPEHPDHP